MRDFEFYRPRDIEELKANLSLPGARILAGGTDVIPKMRRGILSPNILVDSTGLKSLNFIEDQGEMIVIGSMTTHQQIAESRLIQEINPALWEAVRSIGCIQTRCRGTLGGNIANASPAGDTLPPLLIHDARVLIQSLEGEREVLLDELILGPGQTDLRQGEFIHSISFPPFKGNWGSHFIKVGKRSGMAISVVNVAAAVILDDSGLIAEARLALGAVGPEVIRCRKAEEFLIGKKPGLETLQKASARTQAEIHPIRDIRSTEGYRIHAAGVIARRVLEVAVEWAQRRSQ